MTTPPDPKAPMSLSEALEELVELYDFDAKPEEYDPKLWAAMCMVDDLRAAVQLAEGLERLPEDWALYRGNKSVWFVEDVRGQSVGGTHHATPLAAVQAALSALQPLDGGE